MFRHLLHTAAAAAAAAVERPETAKCNVRSGQTHENSTVSLELIGKQ
jgi:uncharacterized protein YraI